MATLAVLVGDPPVSYRDSRSYSSLTCGSREDAGGWSSFALQVGNPPQVARVLVSTAGHAPWVISNLACSPDLSPSCSEFRGGVFNSDDSRTWNQLGYFALDIETNLSPPDNATYGFETVALGLTNVTGGPVLENQVVAALSGTQYALGTVGLNQEPTNLSVFTDPHPSFLTTLYSKKLIPSLSWSYTAGAKYRKSSIHDLSILIPLYFCVMD